MYGIHCNRMHWNWIQVLFREQVEVFARRLHLKAEHSIEFRSISRWWDHYGWLQEDEFLVEMREQASDSWNDDSPCSILVWFHVERRLSLASLIQCNFLSESQATFHFPQLSNGFITFTWERRRIIEINRKFHSPQSSHLDMGILLALSQQEEIA